MATSSSSSSSLLNPSSSFTTCSFAENRQRRKNAGSRLPQILEAERNLSVTPKDLSDGAAGVLSAATIDRSKNSCIEELDDAHADTHVDATQVDEGGEDSSISHQTDSPTEYPEQSENYLFHPEEGYPGYPGSQGTESISVLSVLSVHCSCGTTVDNGKPLMPCLNCGKYSHVSCAGYTIRRSKMKRTKFYCHLCKATKPSKKQSKSPPLSAGISSQEASLPNPSFSPGSPPSQQILQQSDQQSPLQPDQQPGQ